MERGNILSKQTQASFGEMPVPRWKVPTFSGLACISNPFSLPTLWQTTFSPVLPPQHCLCQHNFRASWGSVLAVLLEARCWAIEKAAQEQLFGEWLPCSALPGQLEFCTEGENCLLGGTVKSWHPAPIPQLCDGWPFKAIPDGSDGKGPMQLFGFTVKRTLYKPAWLFPHNMLLHTLLNTVEDTEGLDSKWVNAIYHLAEEIISVFMHCWH